MSYTFFRGRGQNFLRDGLRPPPLSYAPDKDARQQPNRGCGVITSWLSADLNWRRQRSPKIVRQNITFADQSEKRFWTKARKIFLLAVYYSFLREFPERAEEQKIDGCCCFKTNWTLSTALACGHWRGKTQGEPPGGNGGWTILMEQRNQPTRYGWLHDQVELPSHWQFIEAQT